MCGYQLFIVLYYQIQVEKSIISISISKVWKVFLTSAKSEDREDGMEGLLDFAPPKTPNPSDTVSIE